MDSSIIPPKLLLLLAFLVGIPLVLVWLGAITALRSRSVALRAFAATAAACSLGFLCLVVWYLFLSLPGKSGLVASGTSPGGREYCVVQSFQDLAEPYQVSLFVRDPARMWRWHYLEHEDFAWRSARVDINDDRAVVYRNGERFAEVELVSTPAEPDVVSPNGYISLETLPPEFSIEEVVRLHNQKYR